MAQPAHLPATYEDITGLSENKVGEIVHGVLHVSPRPAGLHCAVGSLLGAELIFPFQRGRGGPGGWLIVDEPELHLGEDVVVPDLAGWRRERLPRIPNRPFFTLAPDWVCEILSPRTARFDRVEKRALYAREGTSHLWLLDPLARTLEVYRLEGSRFVEEGVFTDDAPVRVPPFDAIELDLGSLWSDVELPTEP
jgi:Uma2 family endonuclease